MLLLVAGCSDDVFPGKPKAADRPVPEDEVLSFDTLFQRNCAGCHGQDGRFGPAPPLNDPIFLAIVPEAELLRVLQAGRGGTPMPAFSRSRGGPLTDPQVKALAEGIKIRWQPAANATPKPPGYLAAKRDDDSSAPHDRQRAATVFARACAGCHGADGEQGKGTARAGAIHDPAFLSLISDQALRRIIITGRPDLKMPDFAGDAGRAPGFAPLTSADIDELVALLADWRRDGQRGVQQKH